MSGCIGRLLGIGAGPRAVASEAKEGRSRVRLATAFYFSLLYLLLVGFAGPVVAADKTFSLQDIRSALSDYSPLAAAHSEIVARSNAHPSGVIGDHYGLNDDDLSSLAVYVRQIEAEQPTRIRASGFHGNFGGDDAFLELQEYARRIGVQTSQSVSIHKHNSAHQFEDPALAALHEYTRQIEPEGRYSTAAPHVKVAEANNAFDALRDFLQRDARPPPPPTLTPDPSPKRTKPAARPATPKHAAPVFTANFVGGKTCLFCHATQAAAFDKTVMGKIRQTQPGKLDCENCHGPGSAHIKAVGCAACHGEGGITNRPGIPSLVGQDPEYLVPAMRAYVNGQRKNDLKRLVLSGIGEGELHAIANYYARQPAARAQTPLIGNPKAGEHDTEICASCHGDHGISIVPAWPSLAGQDAQYLANAIRAYKSGSRSKVIACAACHGRGGISREPGMPSLAGQDMEYLVPAMKAYVNGDRKHRLMKALLVGMSDSEIEKMAEFYSDQSPARAQTPLVGDPSAGRSAAGVCIGCHGTENGSIDPAWPMLAGQDSQYLAHAIEAYKSGSRDKTVACASCHGERGISKRAGMPSLAGRDPQYLVTAMKAYVSGERKHALMKALLANVSDAELNSMAVYYARQAPARAQTASVGDSAAGRSAAAVCTGCHGAEGGSLDPAWPTLAGQDSKYLADTIKAYKEGRRDKPVACASCHGERGISKRAGTPSLAGLDPQYLVTAMKAYASGERKHPLMQALLTGVSEAELNGIAVYYARQAPARAQTSSTGDPVAGKAASAACASCHGEQGVSSNPAWPSLAGQDARSLAEAIKAYKIGSRSDATMKALVASLDDRTINDLAAYYASLRPAQPSIPATMQSIPARKDPVLVENGLVAGLDARTINDLAAYYASLRPAQPSIPADMQSIPAREDPVLVINGVVAGLDARTISDVASYFASLGPERSKRGDHGGKREPVVIRNNLVASLDERSIPNVSSYYATLRPEQPEGHGRDKGVEAVPARVGVARPADHSSIGGIVSFRADDPSRSVDDINAICLGCHEKGERTLWSGSTHEVRGVACTSCHLVMRNVTPKFQLAKVTEMDTCFQCHKDKQAKIWRSAHMPIREGKMTCSSCHNPHGSYGESLLKQATINDNCYQCHAEKRGPFLYEHPPVRENCLNCHDPHGSNNDFLLKISRPRLCQQCHANLTGHPGNPRNPTSLYAINRECQNCHSQHHGSNTPGAGARWHR